MDGHEQVDTPLGTRLKALKNDLAEVDVLLKVVQAGEWVGPDATAEALLDCRYRLQREEGDPEPKILVFTDSVPTRATLRDFLTDRGFVAAGLNGSMNIGQWKRAPEELAEIARILVSMDVGREGLSLQFRRAVISYDIPWNPMRIEQRFGRIGCIGQPHAIRAVNLLFEEAGSFRIGQVLEEKLTVVLFEFGIDKASDVLDSADRSQTFERLYADALLHLEEMDKKVENVIDRVRK